MYFKILSEDLTHHGYTYHEGLNVDPNPFDPTPNCRNGLFFADEKHILDFYYSGDKIATVTIPDGEKVVQMENGYKAHKIILSEIRDLWTVETFEWLKGYDADICTFSRRLLYRTIEEKYLEVTKYLIEQDMVAQKDKDPILCLAAEKGYLDIVKCLVERGSNGKVIDNITMCNIIRKGYLHILKYLAMHGLDIHMKNDSALCVAALNGKFRIVKYLIKENANIHTTNDFALFRAAEKGYLNIVKLLIESETDGHIPERILYIAVEYNRLEIVKYLVELGVGKKNKALKIAKAYEHSDIIQYLEEQET
jgi:hypothetical protein